MQPPIQSPVLGIQPRILATQSVILCEHPIERTPDVVGNHESDVVKVGSNGFERMCA